MVTKTSPSRSVNICQPCDPDVFPSLILTVPRQADIALNNKTAVFAIGNVKRASVCSTGQLSCFRKAIYATSMVAKNTDSDVRMMDNATLPVLNLFIGGVFVNMLIHQ